MAGLGQMPEQAGLGQVPEQQGLLAALRNWYARGGIAGSLGMTPAGDQIVATTEMARKARAQGDQMAALDAAMQNPMAGMGPENLGLGGFAGMVKAYHGSPHRFDKFSMDKIGTGEGAQAYGHGLYFAENPDVAHGYKYRESQRHAEITLDGKPLQSPQDFWKAEDALESEDWRKRKIFDKFFAETQQGYEPSNAFKQMRDWWRNDAAMLKAVDEMEQRLTRPAKDGALYNVSLDVEPEDLLDWDASLPRQSSKVKEALEKAGIREQMPNASGRAIYQALQDKLGSDAAASRALAEAGIPGLRYFDAGSRGKGEGSRNVVMFGDDRIRIDEVDGQPMATKSMSPQDYKGDYPLADYDDWWGDRTYEGAGGRMVEMTPDEYLGQVRKIDPNHELTVENVQDLIDHIQGGGKLDPLAIYSNGKEDGRHRALAAKKLGYKTVPVLDFRGSK